MVVYRVWRGETTTEELYLAWVFHIAYELNDTNQYLPTCISRCLTDTHIDRQLNRVRVDDDTWGYLFGLSVETASRILGQALLSLTMEASSPLHNLIFSH